jgi:RHS repeat-associated protein
MQWLMTAHVRRYNRHHRSSGHVWQGRFKAFPIQQDAHLLTVLRYVERNPLRAGLVRQAENWPWSSLRSWVQGARPAWLAEGPVDRPRRWLTYVNRAETAAELQGLRRSVQRGTIRKADVVGADRSDGAGATSTRQAAAEETKSRMSPFFPYDPATGRFLQRIGGIQGGLNAYSYVVNNPLKGVDPRGLKVWTEITGGGSHVELNEDGTIDYVETVHYTIYDDHNTGCGAMSITVFGGGCGIAAALFPPSLPLVGIGAISWGTAALLALTPDEIVGGYDTEIWRETIGSLY